MCCIIPETPWSRVRGQLPGLSNPPLPSFSPDILAPASPGYHGSHKVLPKFTPCKNFRVETPNLCNFHTSSGNTSILLHTPILPPSTLLSCRATGWAGPLISASMPCSCELCLPQPSMETLIANPGLLWPLGQLLRNPEKETPVFSQ